MESISLQQEFMKNPNCDKSQFYELHDWLMQHQRLPKIQDWKLFQFWHSCYFDNEKTKKCVTEYYTLKSNSPEFFLDRNVDKPELQTALKHVNIVSLPVLTEKGYRITFIRFLQNDDITTFVPDDIGKLFTMEFDRELYKKGTSNGHIIIMDTKNVTFRHIFKCSMSTWKKVIKLTQEALPVRMKTLHVLNANYFCQKLMLVLKPFIDPRIFNTIHLYQEGAFEKLFNYVPPECLPQDFGGYLPSVDSMAEKSVTGLRELTEFFAEDDKLLLKNF